ncbi:drug/metabolite transporter (DMT)-like permease [Kibdelosporangium banguiense]|uniref:Drug/metabolite transporter (DMT)-like permease n=1 Tax=Kibdelosporangium banguiense TaxID=1365924 RepID=A0ABS4U0J2_9PSEU|nr:DUF998 domain-containing protein [Kibdelosporangium banguiense]MBP2329705.1 drug/metabolite transporter (DMT)-like permease [Kibdelosporangium banguiense]
MATKVRGRGLLDSVSGYYYSDLRNVFVGSMCAIGVFLIFYKGVGKADDRLSTVAGAMAVLVALCPTWPPGKHAMTRWEEFIGWAHIVSAVAFFLILAVFCFLFTKRERVPLPDPQRKRVRNRIYVGCGCLILLCLLLILIFFVSDGEWNLWWHPILWFEAFAIFAFGVSWLIKGGTLVPDRR